MAFNQNRPYTWCPGCGNMGIVSALRMALTELKLNEEDVLLCFDIGCNGNMNDKITGFRVHTLHGRVIPVAAGAKLARKDKIIIAMAGDGATYAEGINHLVHAIRRDFPITLLVHDNQNYGLTTGQCSPTTIENIPMNSNPHGQTGKVFNPVKFANALDCSFLAQGFSGDFQGLKEIIKIALMYQVENKKFSMVNILQSCPTYNKFHTTDWYLKNIVNLPNDKYTYKSKLIQNAENINKEELIENHFKYVGVINYK